MNIRSVLELLLYQQLPTKLRERVERNYRFAPPRRWMFDFAWVDERLAAEVEGGTWIAGRHSRGQAFEADCEKYNAAVLAGWRVLRFTTNMVRDGRAVEVIAGALPVAA